MRVKHRYIFTVDGARKKIFDFVIKSKIKYNFTEAIQLLVFEVYEDDENWETIEKFKMKYDGLSLASCVFSKKEIENASWLTVRSIWRWEYPQPEDTLGFKRDMYANNNICDSCGCACGLTQKNSFKVKKSPKWGRRNFLMLNWVEDELFISSKVATALEESEFKGFNLLEVNHFKKNSSIENIMQIKVNEILKQGMIIKEDTIKKEINCPKCGRRKYITTGRGRFFDKEIFRDLNVDIIKSYEVFGEGNMCARVIFISNAFYRVITENGYDKNLVFEPAFLNN